MSDRQHSASSNLSSRLTQIATSAALTADSGAAAVFIRDDLGQVERLGEYGERFGDIEPLAYVALLEAIAGGSTGFISTGDPKSSEIDGRYLNSLPTWNGRQTRFTMIFVIHDEHHEPLGLLAIADSRPRAGLSAARIYVLKSLANQIADALCMHSVRLGAGEAAKDHERLRLLESVVTHAKDSILITEAEPIHLPGPRIVYTNAAFTETTGYSAEEVLGKTPRILQGVDTNPQSRAAIGAALAQWKPIEIEILNYRKDGTPFWVELSIAPVADERGWFTHWISVQRDVTERKLAHEVQTRVRLAEASNAALQTLTNELRVALDAAEAANIAKSQFLANMSHEIRTPLNGVLGMAQALWLDDLSPVQRQRLSVIRESGQSLLTILNDVLDLSKIEAGKMELEEIEFDLADLTRGVCSAFAEQADNAGVAFDLTIADEAQGTWVGDAGRLKQILYNLISNALKFTADGSVRIEMGLSNAALQIAVADTGIGISAEKVEALFSKFYQADSSTTRRFGGTGLGLSICRQLCELMGGTITVATAVNEGSRFTVVLPLKHVGRPAGRGGDLDGAQGDQDVGALSSLRILVAEDNLVNQMVITALLQAFGNTPVVVGNGRLAVELSELEAFDIILMDIQMPEMDGMSATRLIRQREAELGLPAIPIIAVSANAMTHQVQEYLAIGMNGHISKPIDVAELAGTLETLVGPKVGARSDTPLNA